MKFSSIVVSDNYLDGIEREEMMNAIDFSSFKREDRSLRGAVARTPCIKVGAKGAVRDIGAEEPTGRASQRPNSFYDRSYNYLQ